MSKIQIYGFCKKLYMQHIFWSCLIRCINMTWIQSELSVLQSGHGMRDGRTDGRSETNTQLSCVGGIMMLHIDGLVQERRNPIANALELHLSSTNPLIGNVFSHQLSACSANDKEKWSLVTCISDGHFWCWYLTVRYQCYFLNSKCNFTLLFPSALQWCSQQESEVLLQGDV